MTAKSGPSQWPEIISTASGAPPISPAIAASEASRLRNIARMSGIHGQGPPPWEMK